ncbi:alpha mannosidase-like protein [Serendipita sp. 398]|nr:alpha mannosidase-like protein [Serendipita sp. 398]
MFLWHLIALSVFHISLYRISDAKKINWTSERKLEYREATRELWEHGYESYMSYAFPMDELMPLSCFGRGPDWDNPSNIGTNDVAGNYSLTLVDILDTLAIMGNQQEFSDAVENVINWVQFDVDTKPQVFEVTIRVLGGLLSGHILASEERLGHKLDWYQGQLLALAKDLGERLLPAFKTDTGLPYARINLRHGVLANESTETCVAGAGSLILEFGTLSRLTGDDRFEKAAYKAFFGLWNRRSDIGLVGNNIDVHTGKWGTETTGIGAGVDSFYEYALKWYVLSGEVEFLDVWNEAYGYIMSYARAVHGYSYRIVSMTKGFVASVNVDSLSAFWGGLQVLAGDVQNAIKSHLFYWNLWRKYHAIPELFDTSSHVAVVKGYPLRPEFIETTFFLYQVTKDPFYLDVGAQVLHDLQERIRTPCGLATISDVIENTLDDRMESFVLSETLKYLYLLFDEFNPLASTDSNIVFTTEGHILTLNNTHLRPMSKTRRLSRKYENLTCPIYDAYPDRSAIKKPSLRHGIRNRPDYDYARTLVGLPTSGDASTDDLEWSTPYGTCEVPSYDTFSYDVLLSRQGQKVEEDQDISSLSKKLNPWKGGVLVNEVMGLRVQMRNRFDGKGYDITKIGHLNVRQGEKVFFNDSLLFGERPADKQKANLAPRAKTVPIKFFTVSPEDPSMMDDDSRVTSEFIVEANTAEFGVDLDQLREDQVGAAGTFGLTGSHLVRVPDNANGCQPYHDPNGLLHNAVVFIERGECLFIEKLFNARKSGAAGVVVWHDSEEAVNPVVEAGDLAVFGAGIEGAAMVVIPASAAAFVVGRLVLQEQDPRKHKVMVKVEKEWPEQLLGQDPQIVQAPTKTEKASGKILYINGNAMINTELLF